MNANYITQPRLRPVRVKAADTTLDVEFYGPRNIHIYGGTVLTIAQAEELHTRLGEVLAEERARK